MLRNRTLQIKITKDAPIPGSPNALRAAPGEGDRVWVDTKTYNTIIRPAMMDVAAWLVVGTAAYVGADTLRQVVVITAKAKIK